jgi:four helix bundle protein
MQDFTKLIAWQRSQRLSIRLIGLFTPSACRRIPGFRGQILRAGGSVPAALAEGCGKQSNLELARFADIALGSLSELRSHLYTARDAQLLDRRAAEELLSEADQIRRLIFALAREVRRRNKLKLGVPNAQGQWADPDPGGSAARVPREE